MLQSMHPDIRPRRLVDLQLCQAVLALQARFAPQPQPQPPPFGAPSPPPPGPTSMPDPSARTHLNAMWSLLSEHGLQVPVLAVMTGSPLVQQALMNPR